MADFLERLSQVLESRQGDLLGQIGEEAEPDLADLSGLVRRHWSALPPAGGDGPAAYAVDGSLVQMDLENGCYVLIAQALCLGTGGYERSQLALEVLPPTVPRATAARLADLLQRHAELDLARAVTRDPGVAAGSVLYLDGALYGLLPQLYPARLESDTALPDYPEQVLAAYLDVLAGARARDMTLLALSKTSREATHVKLWRDAAGAGPLAIPLAWSDAGMLARWTADSAGFSRPVILGRRGFTGGSTELLDQERVARSPAIVSCFVRLAPMDGLLRLDLPAGQVGDDRRIGDLDAAALDEPAAAALAHHLAHLAADYGGSQVYNALLYSVDRAVRLGRRRAAEVYLPLIGRSLGVAMSPDRSSRRFL